MVPALDRKTHRPMLSPGALSRAVGVDGRFAGRARRFPGMRYLTRVVNGTTNNYSDFKFFRYVSIQKGNTAYTMRGFVCLALNSATAKYDVVFYYYDSQTSAWVLYEIETDAKATADIDVATNGKYLYYTKLGAAPQVVWHNASTLVKGAMGPGSFPEDFTDGGGDCGTWTATDASTGGFIQDGTFLVGYRYHSISRNVYGAMKTHEVVANETGSLQSIVVGVTGVSEANTNIEDFDEVEIFRSISVSAAGSSFQGGRLFKEGTASITDAGSTRSWTFTCSKTNEQLVTEQEYLPQAEEAYTPPNVGRIASYQGITVVGGSSGTTTADSLARLQWSAIASKTMPESFPGLNTASLPDVDSQVEAFVPAGDFLFALCSNAVIRIQRVADQLLTGTVHLGRGPSSRHAVCPVDNGLLMATPSALMLLNASNAALQQLGAVDGVLLDDWKASMDKVSICNDSVLGCTFVLNSTAQKALCIWHGNSTVTELEDCNFTLCTTGSHPVTLSPVRGFFLTGNGLIVFPDAEGSATKATMLGVAGTVNGTVTSYTPATKTMVVAEGSMTATGVGLLDCVVHVLTGANAGQSAVVASNSATDLVFTTDAFTETFAAADVISISPIPFRLRYWPLGLPDDIGYPRYMFRRYVVHSMVVNCSGLAGEYATASAFWTVGCCRQMESTATVTGTVTLSANPVESSCRVVVDGSLVEPCIEQMAANVQFDLNALDMKVRYTGGEHPGDP
jgi:hypothetical protein